MRLIDADKLLELIKEQREREIGAYAKGINAGLNIVKSIINNETQTPTVYDVDKIVEHLEELKQYNLDLADMILDIQTNGPDRHFVCLEDVVDVVRAGGIANECGRYENSHNSNSDEPCRRCVPKEIVDKIEQRNALNKEIYAWCMENLNIEGMDPDTADITDYYTGEEQGDDGRDEWCDQTCLGEDWYAGEYYWETEYEGKYLHMTFNC